MTTNTSIKKLYDSINLNKREIDLILCHVLNINTASLFIYDNELSEQQNKLVKEFSKQRLNGKPLAYITGNKSFWTLDLKVNQHTLVPRPETEQIIELVLAKTNKDFAGKILDLGTGSGAIALSLAQELPLAKIVGIDFSKECIKVALFNQQKYVLKNANIFQSDWFESIKNEKFDFIVANPPYVAEGDKHLTDLSFEPISALTAKNNGLADLFHIIKTAKNYLTNNGIIILEHGYSQFQSVQSCLIENHYNHVKSHKDLSGITRITTAQLQYLDLNK